MIDYRELLKKYMSHVRKIEVQISPVEENIDELSYLSDDYDKFTQESFTQEEWKILKSIEKEV